ncbi:hypothetical protein [Paraeggerthella sp. Marseille-Q4926]|uniref:hypothetical protein n=1 Tax=Paraeggerthella sp. Marseille-Q4926 TaxID=2866587 RepID=UPI001CE46254|nr:hypothetical protein [Paraeggerthella sp. Marseille-Q4926]
MARKIRQLIIELREQGLSRRKIAATRRMSMESVCEVFDIAAECGIAWDDVKGMTECGIYHLFYSDKHVRESAFEDPDRKCVYKEMAEARVNLRLLHDECRDKRRQTGKAAMSCIKFCGDHGD